MVRPHLRRRPPRTRRHPARRPDTAGNVADWLATLYQDRERFWSGLRPDPLAEYFIGTVLGPSGGCPGLVVETLDQVSAAQLEHGLTLLGRAHPHHPHLTHTITDIVLTAGIAGAVAAIAVAPRLDQPQPLLTALDQLVTTADMASLAALDVALPRFSLLLGPDQRERVAASRRVLPGGRRNARPGCLSARPGAVGERPRRPAGRGGPAGGGAGRRPGGRGPAPGVGRAQPGCLPARPGRVGEQPRHPAGRGGPAGRRPGRRPGGRGPASGAGAGSTATPTCPTWRCRCNNLAVDLGEAGRRAEGLAAAQEAVDLRRELVGLNRDAYLPDLAVSVNNLAVRPGRGGPAGRRPGRRPGGRGPAPGAGRGSTGTPTCPTWPAR